MKKFNIEVISKKPETHNRRKHYRGRITIGDFTETFLMRLDNWTIAEYEQQWRDALERIRTHDSSCLVVNFTGSLKNPWIELWVLYREGDTIFIQNHYLFYEIFEERSKGLPPFDAKTCYLYVLPRETINEDGKKISEWQTTIHDLPSL